MKKFIKQFTHLFMSILIASQVMLPVAALAADCNKSSGFFRAFPTWYEYLGDKLDDNCNITNFELADSWLVALALLDILLRLAGLIAFGYIVYMGFKFVLARGNPSEMATARQGIVDAVIGLAIAGSAAGIVSFIARSLAS
jgi:hypothetical protein